MPFKVSFPFGDKHPVLAVIILLFVEGCVLLALWRAYAFGTISGRGGTAHVGDGWFEIALVALLLGAIAVPALMLKVIAGAWRRKH
jgi:hypothetical protein